VSTGVDKKERTLKGGGALERGDLRLLEDSSERRGALGSDQVGSETASEGRIRAVRESACQWELTNRRILRASSSRKQPT